MMKALKIVLMVVLVLSLAACGQSNNAQNSGATNQPEQVQQAPAATHEQEQASSTYPKTFVDGRGKEVVISQKPTSIVSTTLAIDEILIELADESNISAVTQLSTDPSISNVAGKTDNIKTKFQSVTAEQILALQPDLVLIPSYVNPEVLDQLESANITTYQVVDDTSFDGIFNTVKAMGEIIGEEANADRLLQDLTQRFEQLKQDAGKVEQPKRVIYYTEYLSSVTDHTTIGEMINLAGGSNVITEAGIVGDDFPDYPNVSKELLVTLNPEVIFTTAWGAVEGGGEPAFVLEWKNDPALANVEAIKNNQIYVLDSANVTTASHFVIEGAEEMKAILTGE